MIDIEKIKEYLRLHLSEFRYTHSLLVADEAKKLAIHYKIDSDKAYLAGLVHDIAKEFSEQENQHWICKYYLEDVIKTQNKKTIHAYVGCYVVKELYNLDEEICDAIKYHSIGNIKMNTFHKIVFIADKIGRENLSQDGEDIKKLAYVDLDKAIIKYLEKKKIKLHEKGLDIHNDTKRLLEKLNLEVK